MLQFPTSTYLHKRLPKEAFYRNLTLSPTVKAHFVSDIDSIYIEYGLSKENLNLANDSDIETIYLMQLILKKQDYDPKILEAIARQNPNRLVFLLVYEDQIQLALYEKKLYCDSWSSAGEVGLKAQGQSLQRIWDGFIMQIALGEGSNSCYDELPVEERLQRQDKIKALEKQIIKMEAVERRERQPHKKFELHQKLELLREELEECRNE